MLARIFAQRSSTCITYIYHQRQYGIGVMQVSSLEQYVARITTKKPFATSFDKQALINDQMKKAASNEAASDSGFKKPA
jgi:hypothetical protein